MVTAASNRITQFLMHGQALAVKAQGPSVMMRHRCFPAGRKHPETIFLHCSRSVPRRMPQAARAMMPSTTSPASHSTPDELTSVDSSALRTFSIL